MLVATSDSQEAFVWETESWKVMYSFKGHENWVTGAIFAEDVLVTSSFDFTLRMWDLRNGEFLKKMDDEVRDWIYKIEYLEELS